MLNNKIFLFFFFPNLFNSFLLHAQDIPATSKGEIHFYVDQAGFLGKDGKTYEEFYLMLFADQFNLIKKDRKQYCSYKVEASLKNNNNNKVVKKSWTTDAILNQDSLDIKGTVIYDQWAELIEPGKYSLSVEVWDQNSSNNGKAQTDISIPDMNKDDFIASQLEFAVKVEDDSTKKTFFKAGKAIIPNSSRRFGILNPILYIYYELYNIPVSSGENLIVDYSIINSDARAVKKLPSVHVRKPGRTSSIMHGINVSSISSGIYELNVEIRDSSTDKKINLSRRFEVIQPDYASLASRFSEGEAQIAGNQIKFIASPAEYDFYNNLDLTGKAQFLVKFWQERDPSPGTIDNEYLKQIQQRYYYANEHFSWAKNEGWKSDRGRILIKYGMPDEIEAHHSEAETLSYEKWFYNTKQNYEFDFGDLMNDGRFILLNSNKEGEVHNSNWKQEIGRL
jgi:GWxTD domain-containing protein